MAGAGLVKRPPRPTVVRLGQGDAQARLAELRFREIRQSAVTQQEVLVGLGPDPLVDLNRGDDRLMIRSLK
jgi:hypothetical protein